MAETAADWASRPETGSAAQLRLMRFLALTAPRAVTGPLIRAIATVYALRRNRPEARASAAYLARLLGRPPRFAERRRLLEVFAQCVLERARLLATGLDGFEVAVTGRELIDEAVASGRGAVLLGAHFGSFEAMRAFERRLPGLEVHYLMWRSHAGTSSALLDELNREVASRVIALDDGRDAMLAVFERLSAGRIVAFLGDRSPVEGHGGVEATLLGGRVTLPRSPYVAALAARVPLIFCAAPRIGYRRYAIEFRRLHDGAPVPRTEREAVTAALAQGYAAALEDMCRRHPCNWFNFFDFWRG